MSISGKHAEGCRIVARRQCRLHAMVETVRAPNHPVPTCQDVERLLQSFERRNRSAGSLAIPPDRLMNAIVELPPRSSGAPIETLAQPNSAGRRWTARGARLGSASRSSRGPVNTLRSGSRTRPPTNFLRPSCKPGSRSVPSSQRRVHAAHHSANNRVVSAGIARSASMRTIRIDPVRTSDLAGESPDSDRVRTSLMGTVDYLAERFPLRGGIGGRARDPPGTECPATALQREYRPWSSCIPREHPSRRLACGSRSSTPAGATAIGLASRQVSLE